MSIVHSISMTSSTIVVTDNTVKLGITLPKSMIQKIDNKRGDIPRSRYIRRAIERYLGSESSKNIDNKVAARPKYEGKSKENERHRE